MARSPIIAVIMMVIPFVGIYLLYRWFEELKDATKADYNSIVQLILCCIPLVNLYILWKFMGDLEAAAQKKGGAYPMGATVFLIACLVLSPIMGLSLLFLVYKTQDLLNLL